MLFPREAEGEISLSLGSLHFLESARFHAISSAAIFGSADNYGSDDMQLGTRPSNLDQFDGYADWIRRRYLSAKKKNGALRPAETARGVLIYWTYWYFRRLEKDGLMPNLKKHVSTRDGERWARNSAGGVRWVLRLIETKRRDMIDSGERARIATELNCANQFDVDPKWILPFLYEAGPRSGFRELAQLDDAPKWAEKYQARQVKKLALSGKIDGQIAT